MLPKLPMKHKIGNFAGAGAAPSPDDFERHEGPRAVRHVENGLGGFRFGGARLPRLFGSPTGSLPPTGSVSD